MTFLIAKSFWINLLSISEIVFGLLTLNVEATWNTSLPEVCGRKPTHRIVGGRSVSPELWPWLVTLRTSWGSAFCGGTLITNQHVLSAAHCLDPFRRTQYQQLLKITLGIYERRNEQDILLDVESFTLHPKFGETQMFHNDIGIITLTKNMDSFMPVCLPLQNHQNLKLNIRNDPPHTSPPAESSNASHYNPSNEGISSANHSGSISTEINETATTAMLNSPEYDYESDEGNNSVVDYDLLEDRFQLNKNINLFEDLYKEGVILGWGRLKEYDKLSDTLQQAEIALLNQTLCDTAYGNVFDSRIMLCGGRLEGGIDSCQGDSGGPLLTRDLNGTWAQIGVVSFGFGCGSPNFPGVYTNVSYYLNWIEETVTK